MGKINVLLDVRYSLDCTVSNKYNLSGLYLDMTKTSACVTPDSLGLNPDSFLLLLEAEHLRKSAS